MNSPDIQVSIVVNSYNPAGNPRVQAMTELALRTYREFTGPSHELILVDGHAAPNAALAAVCTELGYQYLNHGRRLSFAEGYNAGLKAAVAPWRVIAANDIFVVAGWLEALLQTADRTGAWMVSPYLSQSDYAAQQLNYVMSRRTFAPDFLTFNLNLFSPQCLQKVGYIDEQFSGCFNDVDYTLRIRQLGGEVAIAYCGEITHLGRGTLGASGVAAMGLRDHPLFEAKWPGAWHIETRRLTGARGLKGALLAIVRLAPRAVQWRLLELVQRIEPLIS